MSELTSDLFNLVHTAAETLQDEWEPHDVPSPSGIASCRLRQWFQGRRVPRSNRIPVQSIKKMEAGKAIEPFWRTVYERAGFHVISPLIRLPAGSLKGGQGDAILLPYSAPALNLVKGWHPHSAAWQDQGLLLELKDLGIWSFLDVLEKGLREGNPEYWTQIQCYLETYDLPFAVFHAGHADWSAAIWIWTRIKKRPREDLPPFYLEIVSRDSVVWSQANARAGEVAWYVENKAEVPTELRDFDSATLAATQKFPCWYCGWLDHCLASRVLEGVHEENDAGARAAPTPAVSGVRAQTVQNPREAGASKRSNGDAPAVAGEGSLGLPGEPGPEVPA